MSRYQPDLAHLSAFFSHPAAELTRALGVEVVLMTPRRTQVHVAQPRRGLGRNRLTLVCLGLRSLRSLEPLPGCGGAGPARQQIRNRARPPLRAGLRAKERQTRRDEAQGLSSRQMSPSHPPLLEAAAAGGTPASFFFSLQRCRSSLACQRACSSALGCGASLSRLSEEPLTKTACMHNL